MSDAAVGEARPLLFWIALRSPQYLLSGASVLCKGDCSLISVTRRFSSLVILPCLFRDTMTEGGFNRRRTFVLLVFFCSWLVSFAVSFITPTDQISWTIKQKRIGSQRLFMRANDDGLDSLDRRRFLWVGVVSSFSWRHKDRRLWA